MCWTALCSIISIRTISSITNLNSLLSSKYWWVVMAPFSVLLLQASNSCYGLGHSQGLLSGARDLVSIPIHSCEENDFLGDFILSSGYRTIHIGLSYTSGTLEDSSYWSWSDGTPLDYLNWSPLGIWTSWDLLAGTMATWLSMEME